MHVVWSHPFVVPGLRSSLYPGDPLTSRTQLASLQLRHRFFARLRRIRGLVALGRSVNLLCSLSCRVLSFGNVRPSP